MRVHEVINDSEENSEQENKALSYSVYGYRAYGLLESKYKL